MCVSLLFVLIVLKLCIFSFFLHCVLVYLFTFLLSCHVCYLFCVYFVYESFTTNNSTADDATRQLLKAR